VVLLSAAVSSAQNSRKLPPAKLTFTAVELFGDSATIRKCSGLTESGSSPESNPITNYFWPRATRVYINRGQDKWFPRSATGSSVLVRPDADFLEVQMVSSGRPAHELPWVRLHDQGQVPCSEWCSEGFDWRNQLFLWLAICSGAISCNRIRPPALRSRILDVRTILRR